MCRYVTMQLTQWFQPQEATIISFTKSWSTVILKVMLMLMLTIISFTKSWSTVILKVKMIDDLDVDNEAVLDHHDQGCIFRLTCSQAELTKDHVLTSAYVKILEPSPEML